MGRSLVLLLAFVTSGCSQINHGPVTYDVTPLLSSHRLDLRGGETLTFDSSAVRIHFVDPLPQANWGHPAEFHILDSRGQIIEKRRATLPPRRLREAPLLEGELPRPIRARFALSSAHIPKQIEDPARNVMLIINGDADIRHLNDTEFLYRTLRLRGFRAENIHISDSVYRDTTADLDGDGRNDISYASTSEAVQNVLKELARTLTVQDKLFLVVNDHGERLEGDSTIALYDEEVPAKTFKEWLEPLRVRQVTALFQQCYGGGFIKPLRADNRVLLAAAADEELSWATEDLMFDEFLYHFTSALAGQTHLGQRLSVRTALGTRELFGYALLNDSTAESPVLESPLNSLLSRNALF